MSNDKPEIELTPEQELKVQKIIAIYEEIGIEKVKAMSPEELEELNDDIECSFIIEERMASNKGKKLISFDEYRKKRAERTGKQDDTKDGDNQ
jgi:hypothetical protein